VKLCFVFVFVDFSLGLLNEVKKLNLKKKLCDDERRGKEGVKTRKNWWIGNPICVFLSKRNVAFQSGRHITNKKIGCRDKSDLLS